MDIRSSQVDVAEIVKFNQREIERVIEINFFIYQVKGISIDFELHYVYALEDPRNDVVYYIGKTNDAHQRLVAHLNKSHSKAVRDWVTALKGEGLLPRYRILRVVPRYRIAEVEEALIRKYTRNKCLLNLVHNRRSRHQAGDAHAER